MEMKKPKKLLYEAGSDSDNEYIIGYNQCWEDREAWLKQSASADKILESIYTPMKENEDWGEWGKRVAEAISKSIIGK